MTIQRPSGQTVPWYHGFDWATGHGPHYKLDCADAIHAYGYNLDSPEADQFDRGARFAQNEQQGEFHGYGD
jgi:hypothetical protein